MQTNFTAQHDRHPEQQAHLVLITRNVLDLLNRDHHPSDEQLAQSCLRLACLTEGVIRPDELFTDIVADQDELFIWVGKHLCLKIDRNGNVEVCTE